jgi:hypothetical protein
MAWRRLLGDHGTTASVLAAALLLAGGCVSDGDSQASFDPVGEDNTGATAGDGNGSGGSKVSGAGTSNSGAQANAGSSSGGAGTNAGSSNAGTDAGGTDSGGTGTGGTDAGGTDLGGSAGSSTNGGSGTSGSGGAPGGGMGGNTSGGKAGAGGGPACTPKPEICDGLDNNCDKVVDPQDTCPAGCSGATYGGHIYYFCGLVDSANQAMTKCTGLDMAMVSIQSMEENTFVLGGVAGPSWLGASDEVEEGHWAWFSTQGEFWNHGPVDGAYQHFGEGEPDNDGPLGADENCLIIQAPPFGVSRGFWDDVGCSSKGYFATCESTGPVLLPF